MFGFDVKFGGIKNTQSLNTFLSQFRLIFTLEKPHQEESTIIFRSRFSIIVSAINQSAKGTTAVLTSRTQGLRINCAHSIIRSSSFKVWPAGQDANNSFSFNTIQILIR